MYACMYVDMYVYAINLYLYAIFVHLYLYVINRIIVPVVYKSN